MEYHGDILTLWYEELVPGILSKSNYDYHKAQGNIDVYGRGGNGQKILIGYESLPDKYKGMVRELYGDPYVYASRQPILNALIPDHDAYRYYLEYRLPNGELLPSTDIDARGKDIINYVSRYTANVGWLNMLDRLTTDKRALKRELNISMADFWSTATDMIRIKKVSLPANQKRLKDKLRNYIQLRNESGVEAAWESLIETHKFGNTHSAKVTDDQAENLLKDMLSAGDNDTVVQMAYNHWAIENGREAITVGAVRYRRKQWRAEIILEREGINATNKLLSKKIKRKRPSAPLLLINSDDNVWDAYFWTESNPWYRPVLYVVMDTYNDYPLGYAWGDTVTKSLIVDAYRNAFNHVRQLTGDSYCWQQLQTDRWGISGKNTTELENFYQSMGTFTPAALKNANSKYIERAFGVTWHQHLRIICRSHYSGHNIDAKKKINRDLIDPKNFPHVSEVNDKIEEFIWALRHSKRPNSEKSRIQEWVEAFHASDKSKKRLLSSEERLQIFGVLHEPKNGQLPSINASGLSVFLNGERRVFELTQQQIYQHVGKKVNIYYDPYDDTEVLVTDGKGCRFVAHDYQLTPSAIADYEPGDAERIHQLQSEKKTLLPMIQDQVQERKQLLERAQIDAESRIAAGVLQKDIAHRDARVLTGSTEGNQVAMVPFKGFKTGGKMAEKVVITEGVTTQKQSIWDRV